MDTATRVFLALRANPRAAFEHLRTLVRPFENELVFLFSFKEARMSGHSPSSLPPPTVVSGLSTNVAHALKHTLRVVHSINEVESPNPVVVGARELHSSNDEQE